jgi:hypothetical protein
MPSKFQYDRNKPVKYKKPSDKQRKAWARNWYICRLRACFHNCPLQGSARDEFQKLVDAEIVRQGAESEIEREAKRKKELENY